MLLLLLLLVLVVVVLVLVVVMLLLPRHATERNNGQGGPYSYITWYVSAIDCTWTYRNTINNPSRERRMDGGRSGQPYLLPRGSEVPHFVTFRTHPSASASRSCRGSESLCTTRCSLWFTWYVFCFCFYYVVQHLLSFVEFRWKNKKIKIKNKNKNTLQVSISIQTTLIIPHRAIQLN